MAQAFCAIALFIEFDLLLTFQLCVLCCTSVVKPSSFKCETHSSHIHFRKKQTLPTLKIVHAAQNAAQSTKQVLHDGTCVCTENSTHTLKAEF